MRYKSIDALPLEKATIMGPMCVVSSRECITKANFTYGRRCSIDRARCFIYTCVFLQTTLRWLPIIYSLRNFVSEKECNYHIANVHIQLVKTCISTKSGDLILYSTATTPDILAACNGKNELILRCRRVLEE
jgi:hypothetical protein